MKRLLTATLMITLLATPASSYAQPVAPLDLGNIFQVKNGLLSINSPADKPQETPKPESKPEPEVYTVVAGDTLTSVGSAHNVEWQRLWAKNGQLQSPDVLNIGDKITIPAADEALSRDIPANTTLPATTPGVTPHSAPAQATGGLTGSYGYALPYGNCVDLAKSFGKNQPGNPISWSISSRSPWIGAAALFYTNHVAIVVGIWGNGDVELAHANCPGCATRVSANSLRGFF